MRFSRFPAARLIAGLALALVAGCVLFAGTGSPLHAQSSGTSVTLQSGWNLVALPSGTATSAITPPLYTFQPGDTNYETPAAVQTGFGYWAYAGSSTAITLAAGSSSAYSVTAPAGQYFMVGNPSGTQPATVTGADVVYGFDTAANNYVAVTSLSPGQGAWVYSTNGGTITVTPSGAAPATNANSYALDITGADASCTTAGSTITFSVGGASANPSSSATIPSVSGAVHVDLSVP